MLKEITEVLAGHAKDDIVASIGKIIKRNSNKINLGELIHVWLENLLLKYDKPEALGQRDMLFDIIPHGNTSLILGEKYVNLQKLLRIFNGQQIDEQN